MEPNFKMKSFTLFIVENFIKNFECFQKMAKLILNREDIPKGGGG